MKKQLSLLTLAFIFIVASLGTMAQTYKYESFANDPLNTRIYTLNNGMKVYMSVNKEKPRIQTYIAVRVGGKNDPAETTGLAHYFEHLMFKGSEKFGTQNYAAEKPLLDEIERLFEVYRKTTDDTKRKAIYKQIDSVSYQASKLSIPNEYDKLMAAIGADGTNAFTGYDMTVYVEDIPSNQIENWAKIQSDRFEHNVIRGFHTELETVYEEKNMSLTRDGRKVYEKLQSALFAHHPYGTQTVLGTQEHLKNPSITNIKNYYKTWYVPNNMAICVSGDFEPDFMIKTIDKYFGGLKPNPNLPHLNLAQESPITKPIEVEVMGLEAANVTLGWRFGGTKTNDVDILEMIDMILNNGKAGLIDLNLLQTQKVLYAGSGVNDMTDYSIFTLSGTPKEGQTLEQVRDLLLGEIEKLKKGDFNEDLMQATINNFKLQKLYQMEENRGRAMMFVNSFIAGTNWADEVQKLEKASKITKQQIVDFANKFLLTDNYAIIYKRQGKDPNELKIEKPSITPIVTNRDVSSEFLKEIQASKPQPIAPVFVDFNKDLKILKAKSNIPVYYKQNTNNDLFEVTYVFEYGNNHDKALKTAVDYLNFLGTSTLSPEDIKREFYKLACSYYFSVGAERTFVSITGLSENMSKAINLFEQLLNDAKVNQEAYTNIVSSTLKQRANGKLNQSVNFNKLVQYGMYGANSPEKNILSEKELKETNPQTLLDKLKGLNKYEHRILYYGKLPADKFIAEINTYHKAPQKLTTVAKNDNFKQQITTENKVLIAPYDAKQLYLRMISNNGETFNAAINPVLTLYNEYFGGGMNAIVFQEMREARGLAYSAFATLSKPYNLKNNYIMTAQIATQNDKLKDALATFEDIINNMPESENAFKLAKEGIISKLRTDRTTKSRVLTSYLSAKDLGINYDINKVLYEKLPSLTLSDVKAFQEKWVKGRKYTICILGNEKDMDLKSLEKYGTLQRLSQQDIFGY